MWFLQHSTCPHFRLTFSQPFEPYFTNCAHALQQLIKTKRTFIEVRTCMSTLRTMLSFLLPLLCLTSQLSMATITHVLALEVLVQSNSFFLCYTFEMSSLCAQLHFFGWLMDYVGNCIRDSISSIIFSEQQHTDKWYLHCVCVYTRIIRERERSARSSSRILYSLIKLYCQQYTA